MNRDVLIIGAGIIGCAAAYEAAKRGLSVAILERGEPGSGASGVGGGFLSLATKKPGPHRDLARASARLYETLEEALGPSAPLGYRKNGSLIFAEGESDLVHLENLVRQSRESGVRVLRLSPEETVQREPGLSPHLAGALLFPEDAEVFPIRVLNAYREAGERWGVRFHSHTDVQSVNRRADVWEVITTEGEFCAPHIVIAAGAWSGVVGNLFHIEIPVRPRRGQAILVPMEERRIHRPMLSAGYYGAKHEGDSPSGLQLSLWHRPDGMLYVGGTREWTGFDPEPDARALEEIRRRAERVLSDMSAAPTGSLIVGFRPSSLTGLPLLGPVTDRPGLFLATGHEGDGISLAPITGKLLGECLAGESPSLNLEPFALPRAEGVRGDRLPNPQGSV
ncbi:MAG: FAD-binding oxidoreductase [Armatimonadetes bacterium]|nr:FAD-binding oxidoreductase [Armatimonadota bacterium]